MFNFISNLTRQFTTLLNVGGSPHENNGAS